MQSDTWSTRRRVLAAGVAGVVSLAGCLGELDGGEVGEASGDTGGSGDTSSPTETPRTLANHPAAAGLAAQPTLGDVESAPATVVAFEDPSCPRCRAFERNTVPKLRPHVDAGEVAFVVRTYPVIYPWGEPAVDALEATFARDADAFWGLFAHYFDEQDAFDSDNVLPRTREWLQANTDLDAAAVVADAESKAYDDAVQLDLEAGSRADVGRTTPTVFLFKDGVYRTRAAGSVSYDLVKSALEL